MTDLTEQWKKGKLPFGYYYVKFLNGKEGVKKLGEYAYRKLIKEVIDIVPSYEEWEQLKEELKDYEYQHKQDGICYDDLFCKLELARKENRQLKKFLKKAINLVMESNWENHAHYKESIQLRDETNNLLNDSPSPTDLKQG